MLSPRMGSFILILVGSIWGMSNVLAMIAAASGWFSYQPDLETHGIFSLVLTAVFAIKRKEHEAAPPKEPEDPPAKGGEHRR